MNIYFKVVSLILLYTYTREESSQTSLKYNDLAQLGFKKAGFEYICSTSDELLIFKKRK